MAFFKKHYSKFIGVVTKAILYLFSLIRLALGPTPKPPPSGPKPVVIDWRSAFEQLESIAETLSRPTTNAEKGPPFDQQTFSAIEEDIQRWPVDTAVKKIHKKYALVLAGHIFHSLSTREYHKSELPIDGGRASAAENLQSNIDNAVRCFSEAADARLRADPTAPVEGDPDVVDYDSWIDQVNELVENLAIRWWTYQLREDLVCAPLFLDELSLVPRTNPRWGAARRNIGDIHLMQFPPNHATSLQVDEHLTWGAIPAYQDALDAEAELSKKARLSFLLGSALHDRYQHSKEEDRESLGDSLTRAIVLLEDSVKQTPDDQHRDKADRLTMTSNCYLSLYGRTDAREDLGRSIDYLNMALTGTVQIDPAYIERTEVLKERLEIWYNGISNSSEISVQDEFERFEELATTLGMSFAYTEDDV